jgi:hypothetical protein
MSVKIFNFVGRVFCANVYINYVSPFPFTDEWVVRRTLIIRRIIFYLNIRETFVLGGTTEKGGLR